MWGVLALSTSDTETDYILMKETNDKLYQHYRDLYSLISKKTINSVMFRNNQEHLEAAKETSMTNSEDGSNECQIEDILSVPDFFYEICLFVFTSVYSKTNIILSIPGKYEETVRDFSIYRENKNKGFVQISKTANIIGNSLTIILTLLLLCLCVIYQADPRLIDGKIAFSTKISIGDWVVLVAILDYLLFEIRAVLGNESALEGIKGIPIVRQFKFKG
jgi:hypothetical protein